MSEGVPTQLAPHKANKTSPKDTDETTDAYDTIDWLVHHVPGTEPRKVGMLGHLPARLLRQREHDRRPPCPGGGLAAGAR